MQDIFLYIDSINMLFIQITELHRCLFCSKDSPLATHCYSRLLQSVHSAIERGHYSTNSAVSQRNILRIGEYLYSENVTFPRKKTKLSCGCTLHALTVHWSSSAACRHTSVPVSRQSPHLVDVASQANTYLPSTKSRRLSWPGHSRLAT